MPKRPPTGSKGIGGSFESSYDGSYECAAWSKWIVVLVLIAAFVLTFLSAAGDALYSEPACSCESGGPDVVVNMFLGLATYAWGLGAMATFLALLSPQVVASAQRAGVFNRHRRSTFVVVTIVCSALWPLYWALVSVDVALRRWAGG